jgi:hypothetical protein
VIDSLLSKGRIHRLLARKLQYDLFKSSAIHAKHLAVPALVDGTSAPCVAFNFSINIARALCRRDLTVPTAQFRATAVSA